MPSLRQGAKETLACQKGSGRQSVAAVLPLSFHRGGSTSLYNIGIRIEEAIHQELRVPTSFNCIR